ncbi:HesA/MoeB/ThiF family protein [Vibrio sp. 10N]|uniref:HesA/MoeB/ThiF family protein n=1 Tax=Vibrio sp. 10N TaxID=3058938 RepID=UPI002813E21C|nr:thiazole biosynthesis adenylyltransferase ThiF [Vibrio sp. 10N]
MVSDIQFKQYLRQISLPNVGEAGQSKLLDANVLIVGCGGLGTIASMYLTGAGVGSLVIADDDVVEVSNLPRQISYQAKDVGNTKVDCLKASLQQQNPTIRVRSINKKLKESQLLLEISVADVVLDCSDNLETRQAINACCKQTSTDLVSAAAIGWNGQLSVFPFSSSQDIACYRCLYPFDEIKGSSRCSESSVMGPVVGMMGLYQALETIKLLTGVHPQVVEQTPPQLKLFDGLNGQWQTLKIARDEACTICQ